MRWWWIVGLLGLQAFTARAGAQVAPPPDLGCPCGYIVATGRIQATDEERRTGYISLVHANGQPAVVLLFPPEGVGRLWMQEGQWVELVVRRIRR